MKPVRLTFHSGYRHKDGTPYNPKHNDRNGFSKPKSAENNVYINYAALTWGGETFYDSEIACYEACFRPHIKAQNDRNKKARHPERNLSLKQYYKKHPPEETLLYLGNKDNNVGADVLLEIFADYREWLNKECVNNIKGCGVELLNAALHMDEATPHIQYRQIYYATDKDGNFEISQNKALAGLEFERPDITSEISRKNNAKVTFTAVCREKMIEIAKSHGVELIEEPLPKEESGRSLEDYIAHEKLKEEREALYAETENAKQAIQAEREKLCVEKDKVEQARRKANADLELTSKAVFNAQLELQEQTKKLNDVKQEIEDIQDYKTFRSVKEAARAEQEAQEKAEKRRQEQELQRQSAVAMCPPSAGKDSLIDRPPSAGGYPQREKPQESVQNAPESSKSIRTIPNTPKAQTPLKNAQKPSVTKPKECNAFNTDGSLNPATLALFARLGIEPPKPNEDEDEDDKNDRGLGE